jgi:putative ABC transport system ATP-binding protein
MDLMTDIAATTVIRSYAPLIAMRHLSKDYQGPSGRTGRTLALKDLTTAVEAGELVAIVGKSGSGKSTLLNLVAGIDRPTSGEIEVGGVAVHGLSPTKLAAWRGQTIGLVFQSFHLLPTLTVAENVMLPMDLGRRYAVPARRPRALALLTQVGIADHADKFPLALSGGEQQRAAIARALANDPPIVVADEPTGNLDSQTGAAVWTLFRALAAAGKTVMVVTHDPDVATRADRVLRLADGQLVAGAVQSTPRLDRA